MHTLRIGFIGNSLPRQCGISTFTNDLFNALPNRHLNKNKIIAMNDREEGYDYPDCVGFEIRENVTEDYIRAADYLNSNGFSAVSLQHEFGIFGGEAGSHILILLRQLRIPIITTLHTVLRNPTAAQKHVVSQIAELSAKLVVMAEKGREMLQSLYHIPAGKIEVIPHGIPEFPNVDVKALKAELGFSDRTIIHTFGLLSPNKGIEVMIDAMPDIIRQRPDCLYLVLGATHPHLVLRNGEAYRDSLKKRVSDLGLDNHVVFLDRFVDIETLLRMIAISDVYITPYLDEAQMTSGTLAYSFGLGKAVVSTPYWHARELLADGRGVLVPFGDVEATAQEVTALVLDDDRRHALEKRAFEESRVMTWPRTGEAYMAILDTLSKGDRIRKFSGQYVAGSAKRPLAAVPSLKFDYFYSMCDSTGLFQHAVHSIPDRSHGYCIDDNARALLLAVSLGDSEEQIDDRRVTQFASFIQHAWNEDTKRFRNFMSFDRRWLEDQGSEDSHCRTLWALGYCALKDRDLARQSWAADLFEKAVRIVETFTSPRAQAFTLLGLDAYCRARPLDPFAQELRVQLADHLTQLLEMVERPEWVWFEEALSYDNARLSQALIVTGAALKNMRYQNAGLRSLEWLMRRQITPAGIFRPIATGSFGVVGATPALFDQQPLEATASLSACFAAWRVDGNIRWKNDGERSFAWFLGQNDLMMPLVDVETGSCRDGLHSDRRNENRGGESVVSYLLGLTEIKERAEVGEGKPIAANQM